MEDSYLDTYWEDRAEMNSGSYDAFHHSEPRYAEQPKEEEEDEEEFRPVYFSNRCEDAPCCGCCD